MQVQDLCVDIPFSNFFVKCEDNAIWVKIKVKSAACENRAHHVTKYVALGWCELPLLASKR